MIGVAVRDEDLHDRPAVGFRRRGDRIEMWDDDGTGIDDERSAPGTNEVGVRTFQRHR